MKSVNFNSDFNSDSDLYYIRKPNYSVAVLQWAGFIFINHHNLGTYRPITTARYGLVAAH